MIFCCTYIYIICVYNIYICIYICISVHTQYMCYKNDLYILWTIYSHMTYPVSHPLPRNHLHFYFECSFSCLGSQPQKTLHLPTSITGTASQVPLLHQRFAAEMQGVVLNAETAVMSALKQMESQVTDQDQKNLGVFSKRGGALWLVDVFVRGWFTPW